MERAEPRQWWETVYSESSDFCLGLLMTNRRSVRSVNRKVSYQALRQRMRERAN